VSEAARSLRDQASREIRLIENENAQAHIRAEDIEQRQRQAFLAAQRVTENLVAVSRMRQAVDVLMRTGGQGAARTVTASLDRIRVNLTDIAELDEEVIGEHRLAVFRRWLDAYSTLISRLTDADPYFSEVEALHTTLHRTATPLQAEADRLRDVVQATLRSVADDANRERDRLFDVSHRNSHLGRMHQALSDVLLQVRLLKETSESAPQSLTDDMADAITGLKASADVLFPPADHGASVGTRRVAPPAGYAHKVAAVGIAAAIDDLDHAWKAAIAAAAAQDMRSLEMTMAASDVDAVINAALSQVTEALDDVIGGFLIFISVWIAVGILSSALGGIYVYRHATQPLAALTTAISRLAKGDLAVPVPQFRSGAEMIELAEAAEVLRRSSLERIALERDNAHKERRIVKERAEAEKLEFSLRKEEEKMELQRQFVATVSHEFRTPLTIIDGQAQLILRRYDRIAPDALATRMTTVKKTVERMVDLMETMLANSRLEAGKIDLVPEDHNLYDLLIEVCSQQNDISAQHDIVPDIDGLPRCYHGDPRLLRQVFTNLLSNAVKYSPKAQRVDVTAVEDVHGIHIDFRDYGVGVPEDELPKLSSQFFRASTSKGIAGTGIGLHLVRSFVESHGGSLAITSVVGEGSTFSIHLPSAAGQLAA